MGVGDEFQRFKGKYNISADKMASISYRYERITRQLNIDFWGTTSGTAHSLYVGSYGRDTAATGVSDLDIGFVLPNGLYHQYHAYQGNGQSALLQAVKRSIQKTYSTSNSFGDGQVVVIEFQDGIRFEILPAFVNRDNQSWSYPNANGGGSWKTCNPRSEMSAVNIRSSLTNRNLKHLCRMMRIWRDRKSVPMSGMLIDTFAYQFIDGWPHKNRSFLYHDYLARDFFYYLSKISRTSTYWRAPGSGSYVYKTGNFQTKAAVAYSLSLQAITYDQNSMPYSRRAKWREIFGPLFPND